MSVSSDDGKSNPQIHIPAIKRVVRLGPGISKNYLKIKKLFMFKIHIHLEYH